MNYRLLQQQWQHFYQSFYCHWLIKDYGCFFTHNLNKNNRIVFEFPIRARIENAYIKIYNSIHVLKICGNWDYVIVTITALNPRIGSDLLAILLWPSGFPSCSNLPCTISTCQFTSSLVASGSLPLGHHQRYQTYQFLWNVPHRSAPRFFKTK